MRHWYRLLGIFLLAFLAYRVDLGAAASRLQGVRWSFIALGLALSTTSLFLKAIRWHLMLGYQDIRCDLRASVQAYFASFLVGIATPGRVGEVSRVAVLERLYDVPIGLGLSSSALDRIFDLYVLLGLGLAACFHFRIADEISVAFAAAGGTVALFPLLLFSPTARAAVARVVPRRLLDTARGQKFADSARQFSDGLDRIFGARLVPLAALTAASYGVLFLGALALAHAIDLPIGYTQVALTLGLANLLSALPISIAGIGTRDAAFLLCFRNMQLSDADALGFSAAVLVVFYVLTGLVALPFYWTVRLERARKVGK